MPLSNGEQIGAVGTGAAILLAALGGAVKASSLRGDIHNKWQRRVQFSDSALEEQQVDALNELRQELEAVLPQGTDAVAISTFDPTPLAGRTSHIAKLHGARARMERAFRLLRKLDNVLLPLFVLGAIAVVFLTLHYGEVSGADWLRPARQLTGITAAAGLLLAGAAYAVLYRILANGQILSGWAEPPEGLG